MSWDEDDTYLQENPQIERGLFTDWCRTCFDWEKTKGTAEEWERIHERWYPGQAPIDAVNKVLRERLNLVPLGPEHADELYGLIDESREGLKNLVWSQTATPDSTLAFTQEKHTGKRYGIYQGHGLKSVLVGVLELRDKHVSWELGYWLGTKYQGKGIMKKVVKKIVDETVDRPVIAHIRIGNEKSKSVLEYAGLREYQRDAEWIYLIRVK